MPSRSFLIVFASVLFQNLALAQKPVGYVLLDPGHGGPTAGKYQSNGGGYNDSAGAVGQNGLTEEWVNLKVALKAKDIIDIWPITGYWRMPILTRDTDTADISIPQRAEMANTYVSGYPVEELIIIHHNGLARPDTQGVETYWWNAATAIGVWPDDRNYTSVLARKTYDMILDEFWWDRYKRRGYKLSNFWLLTHTRSPSVYSEASSISFDSYEEALFADESFPYHVEQEATALYRGLKSYLERAGIATISVHSLAGDIGLVEVDGIVRQSPWEVAWGAGESHHLRVADPTLNINGYHCYLRIWEEMERGYFYADPATVIVPEGESTHTYYALYQGGPYGVGLFAPMGGEYWTVGDTAWILLDFGSSDGLDNSALIDVWLDRNGGSSGYPLSIVSNFPKPQLEGIPVVPSLPGSNNCKVKVWSRDIVENQAYTYSDQPFYLYLIGDVNQNDAISLGDIVYLINYIFNKPRTPCESNCWPIVPLYRGDVTGDCNVSLADVVYLVNYVTKSGPRPVRCLDLPSARTIAASK